MSSLPYLIPLPSHVTLSLALERLGPRAGSFCLDAGTRYTFVGADPVAVFASRDGFISTTTWDGTVKSHIDHPLEALRNFAARLSTLPVDSYLPFYGGLVGFVSFEWGRLVSGVARPDDTHELPDAWFGLFDAVVVFDHLEKNAYVASLGVDERGVATLPRAVSKGEALAAMLSAAAPAVVAISNGAHPTTAADLTPVSPKRRYREIAKLLQQQLWQGQAQKINLAQRYVGLMSDDPWAVHLRLREFNPTPHAMFLNPGTFALSSTSPTNLLTLDGRTLSAHPVLMQQSRELAGGNAVDSPPSEIAGLLHRLRDELSPLATNGAVQATEPVLSSDARAHHLACDLNCDLRDPLSVFDALATLVPALSMTGFPKETAVELVAQHEPFRRHAYTGAMGFCGPHGRAQFSCTVRLLSMSEGLGYVHAATWLDPRSDIDVVLGNTDAQVAQFFSRLHDQDITDINEQSLY